MIPAFPEFSPITLEHKGAMDALLARCPPLASEYTFTNLFAWSVVNHYQLACFDDGLFIRKGQGRHISFLQPIGMTDGTGAVAVAMEYLAAHAETPSI